MVDQIRRLRPPPPPGPFKDAADIGLWVQQIHDYVASVQSIIDRRILPQLRKVEEEGDGKASSSHTHDAADIDSGTIATARLGSGSATSSTFLRGDQSWATATIDINGTTETTDVPVIGADELLMYDQSSTANRKILVRNLRRLTASTLAATGTTQGAAAVVTDDFHKITSADASNIAVRLPAFGQGWMQLLENAGGRVVSVFPPSGGTINGGTTDAKEDLADATWSICINLDGTDWRKVDF